MNSISTTRSSYIPAPIKTGAETIGKAGLTLLEWAWKIGLWSAAKATPLLIITASLTGVAGQKTEDKKGDTGTALSFGNGAAEIHIGGSSQIHGLQITVTGNTVDGEKVPDYRLEINQEKEKTRKHETARSKDAESTRKHETAKVKRDRVLGKKLQG